jgi:hypothetical protein
LTTKKVLVVPLWIDRISGDVFNIYVNLSRKVIRNGPEYHPEALNRKYEEMLYDHYKRPKYWIP